MSQVENDKYTPNDFGMTIFDLTKAFDSSSCAIFPFTPLIWRKPQWITVETVVNKPILYGFLEKFSNLRYFHTT